MKKIANIWFSLSDKIRFLLAGGFNYAFSYFLYVIFTFILGESNYQINLVLSWFFSSFVSFATQRMLVFCSNGPIVKEYIKCFATWMVSYLINAVLLEFCVSIVHLNVFISQFISAGTAAVASYFLFKFFAFRHSHK